MILRVEEFPGGVFFHPRFFIHMGGGGGRECDVLEESNYNKDELEQYSSWNIGRHGGLIFICVFLSLPDPCMNRVGISKKCDTVVENIVKLLCILILV